jgi:hypothetical protein
VLYNNRPRFVAAHPNSRCPFMKKLGLVSAKLGLRKKDRHAYSCAWEQHVSIVIADDSGGLFVFFDCRRTISAQVLFDYMTVVCQEMKQGLWIPPK